MIVSMLASKPEAVLRVVGAVTANKRTKTALKDSTKFAVAAANAYAARMDTVTFYR